MKRLATEKRRQTMTTLETELATYKKALPDLLVDEGKFALVKGADVVGVFGTYEDALKEGYEKFGLDPFLVKQIQATEQVQFITRPLHFTCHT
jgi:hypothetical protein